MTVSPIARAWTAACATSLWELRHQGCPGPLDPVRDAPCAASGRRLEDLVRLEDVARASGECACGHGFGDHNEQGFDSKVHTRGLRPCGAGACSCRDWRRHRFAPAAAACGLPADVRPRDLRGSLASLLIHEGRSIVEVAAWMGHSPEVCLRDYAQILNDVSPEGRVSAEASIRSAREQIEMADNDQEERADAA